MPRGARNARLEPRRISSGSKCCSSDNCGLRTRRAYSNRKQFDQHCEGARTGWRRDTSEQWRSLARSKLETPLKVLGAGITIIAANGSASALSPLLLRAMVFRVSRVDHDPLRLLAFAKPYEDAVECAQPALADEAVVVGFLNAVALGRVLHCKPSRTMWPIPFTPAFRRRAATHPTAEHAARSGHLALAQQNKSPPQHPFRRVNNIATQIDERRLRIFRWVLHCFCRDEFALS